MNTRITKPLMLLFATLMIYPLYGQMNFADRVIDVSREYYSYPWSYCAGQMLGEPNVYPEYGDIEQAWTADYYGDQRDTVILGFDNYGPIDSIFIYETSSPGFIDSVWIKNPNNSSWQLVYHAIPSYFGDTSRILAIGFPLTSFNVSEVRFTTANDLTNDYLEIDAVAISPATTMPQGPIVPGKSIVFDGIDDKFQTMLSCKSAVNINAKTISAWIKVDGAAPVISSVYDGAGIVCDADAYFGIYLSNFGLGNDSIYFYNYNSTSYYFGMDFVLGEWMHIAYVHENDSLTAYKNGVFYNKIYCDTTEGFYGGFIEIGYNSYNEEFFEGEIESVSIFNRVLSVNEIRESMHVTPLSNEPGLTGHYHFNKSMAYYTNGYDSIAVGSPIFTPSKLPIGPGIAKSIVEQQGYAQFPSTGIITNYSIQNAGEVTVSRIEHLPYAPQTGIIVDSIYWVYNQFSNSNFTADLIVSTNEQVYSTGVSDCRYALYSREFNSSGMWIFIDTAIDITPNSLKFEDYDQTSLGQFMIIREGNCFGIGIDDEVEIEPLVKIYPNPSNGLINIEIKNSQPSIIRVFNTLGQEIYKNDNVVDILQLKMQHGVFFISVETGNLSMTEKIIVR